MPRVLLAPGQLDLIVGEPVRRRREPQVALAVGDLELERRSSVVGRHVTALAGAEGTTRPPAVAVEPLELRRLLVTRAQRASRVVEHREQDVVTAAAKLGAGDLLREAWRQAERLLHRLGDDRVVLVGTVDLLRRPGDEVASIGLLLAQ